MTNFGKNLKDTLAQLGLSQQKLADALHVSQQTVSRWVNGINEPDFDTFLRICEFLDETPESLLGERIKEDKK